MPSPKSGTANNLVNPASPRSATEADDAVAGQVETVKAAQDQESKASPLQARPGDFRSNKGTPFKPDPTKKAWIEIALVDDAGRPVPGAAYRIILPDQSVAEGTLSDLGKAKLTGMDPGNCQVTFPQLDGALWK